VKNGKASTVFSAVSMPVYPSKKIMKQKGRRPKNPKVFGLNLVISNMYDIQKI
jgi:hypothetical protein